VVDAGAIDAPVGRKLDQREVKMAEQLVAALEGAFNPAEFRDAYTDRVRELVERKAKGERIEAPKRGAPSKPKRESLEATLKASLDAVHKKAA
jgi:DNA end-binding protein Ku